jgi:hypothetical protein
LFQFVSSQLVHIGPGIPTANEYMQELPESVQQMVGTVYAMLTATKTPEQIM